jgi:sugar lactone lactonase YvrE
MLVIGTSLSWGQDASGDLTKPETPPVELKEVSALPTHRQTSIISANLEGQPQVTLTCFCLMPDDRIVAGCVGEGGELRVFDAEGKYIESWSTPVKPEAIYVRADGTILLAGEGKLAQLSSGGQLELEKTAPQSAAVNANPEKIREEVIAQAKQRAEQFAKQAETFNTMIERADKEIEKLNARVAELEESAAEASNEPAGQPNDGEQADVEKQSEAAESPESAEKEMRSIKKRLDMYERTKNQYESAKAQFAEMVGAGSTGELTEEQIEEAVKSSTAYKLKASSISATNDEVFLATRALAGYGYEIWRMDSKFENASQIVSELRGCCGQMDVKANENGLFVAENSRHRVCRFDREGKSLGAWGQSAREGIEGFGSCCNPMNVAFGHDDAVYTAEDNTGRIKKYDIDGKLLAVVGSVELVPGCKNVSIAVSGDGSRVYMLDITRHHIVRMDAQPADETAKLNDAKQKSGGVAGALAKGLRAIFASETE